MPAEKIRVEHYEVQGNVIKMKLYPYCPYKVGELIDIDNEKARISGKVIEKLGVFCKMRIALIEEKPKLIN
jgi:hypothetical protein